MGATFEAKARDTGRPLARAIFGHHGMPVAERLPTTVTQVYRPFGLEAARDFVARIILPMVSQLSHQSLDTNPKGRLQKVVLQRSGNLPRYRVLEQSGRNNDRVFTVGVFEHDLLLAIGKASSIKEAGRIAAREALEFMSEK